MAAQVTSDAQLYRNEIKRVFRLGTGLTLGALAWGTHRARGRTNTVQHTRV